MTIPWHNLLRSRMAAQAIVDPQPPPAPPPPSEWVTRGDERLNQADVAKLALALHARWHGDHLPERGVDLCAQLSGAYDDIYAIEPIILNLIREAS